MKKYVVFLLIIPILAFSLKSNEIDIVGKWTGEDKGEIGTLIFDSEGYVELEIKGKKMGGKSFDFKGTEAKITYTLDTSKKPIEIDLVLRDMSNKVIRSIFLIAEFKDKNTMKLAPPIGYEKRATEFNDTNSIILNRVD